MKVHEIMTAHARCVAPDNTLVEAAGLMRELDVGALPVCDNDRVAGIVTDRDITLRAVADGRDPNSTLVNEVMSPGVMYVYADQEVEEAVRIMEERQIRRLPVLNRQKRMVGIVSLGDVATSSNPAFSGTALRDVSQPADPSARQVRLRQYAIDLVPQHDAGRNGVAAARSTSARQQKSTRTRAAASRRKARSATTSGDKKRGGAVKRRGKTLARSRR